MAIAHSNWHHVVPHHPTYIGACYTIGRTHYYTPTPIVPANNPAAAPAPMVEAQKPVELKPGDSSRYQDIAGRLAFEANALCLDMHYNYQHNKKFAEVYAEAYDVLQAAKYLQGKEHKGDREVIAKRMVELDKLFHQI